MKSPTSRWVTIAAMMRSLAGIAVATFLPVYFLKVFPNNKESFAYLNALSLAVGGLISSLLGGIISDFYEKNDLMAKSKVCMYSSLFAFPLTALCCLITKNFWFSITMITLKTLLSASFTSPAMTMM
jgi:MFS family permease